MWRGRAKPAECRARVIAQAGKRGVQLGSILPRLDLFACDAVPRQQVERHEELAAREIPRKAAQALRHAAGDSGRPGGGGDRIGVVRGLKNLRRQCEQGPGSALRIGVEIGKARHRVIVEIERMGIDQRDKRPRRQGVRRDRIEKRSRDRIGRHFAPALPSEHITPPLQPDFARQRFARCIAHAGDLAREGIKRVEMLARRRRRE